MLGEWASGRCRGSGYLTQRGRGVPWSHLLQPLPSEEVGEPSEKTHRTSGEWRERKFLFLVLLLCVFLGELRSWRLAKEIHRVSGILEQKGSGAHCIPPH